LPTFRSFDPVTFSTMEGDLRKVALFRFLSLGGFLVFLAMPNYRSGFGPERKLTDPLPAQ